MKYHRSNIPVFESEYDALSTLLPGSTGEYKLLKIEKPFHHTNGRVKKYEIADLVKKLRIPTKRGISRAYNEACAHHDLVSDVSVPEIKGIIHTPEECSLILHYLSGDALSLFLRDETLTPEMLDMVGMELGKLFALRYLHGDLTSYHILMNHHPSFIDLEKTRRYDRREFFPQLEEEWLGFIQSTQGKRWRLPFSKEQEEIIFEGVRKNLDDKETLRRLEKLVLSE